MSALQFFVVCVLLIVGLSASTTKDWVLRDQTDEDCYLCGSSNDCQPVGACGPGPNCVLNFEIGYFCGWCDDITYFCPHGSTCVTYNNVCYQYCGGGSNPPLCPSGYYCACFGACICVQNLEEEEQLTLHNVTIPFPKS